jgi:DMSO reductase iron-sulfur subunit
MTRGFVFDQNRCTGCHACVLACVIENGLPPEGSWRRVDTFNDRRHPAAPLFHLSLACNHCERPACLVGCPASAYRRDAATGAVVLDADRCLGCRYCQWACPYDAPVHDPERGVMGKCDGCRDRQGRGLAPACVHACPTGALGFDELAGLEGAPARPGAVEGFPDTDLGPALRIVPLHPGRAIPAMTAPPPRRPFVTFRDLLTRRIDLRGEWALAVFTFLAAVLVALTAAGGAGGTPPSGLVVAGLAAAGMAISAVHLGRRERAWRSVWNLHRSWLSREIALFGTFAILAAWWLARAPGTAWLGWLAGAVGLAALAAMDRVYGPAEHPAGRWPHSAAVVTIALFVFAAAARLPVAAAGIGLVKLVLYLGRKSRLARRGFSWRPAVTLLRVGAGLVAPAAVWWLAPAAPAWLVPTLCGLGELIDRGEFYVEIDIPTPRRELARALARRLGTVPPC